jgi:hypothetical protein
MNRTPPADVRRALRREAGFGCPVPDCGNPYLEWHHFDPPWHLREHHDPAGMIALCVEHHAKANIGSFTTDQLRAFKQRGQTQEVIGRFDWMRQDLLAVVGGNFYHETLIAVEFRGSPVVWFTRETNGYLLLSLRMLTASGEERAQIDENFWIKRGEPSDLLCPPSGRTLGIVYQNGDRLGIEFLLLNRVEDARRRYRGADPTTWPITFPVTAVEVAMNVANSHIEFGPRATKVGGVHMQNCFMSRCGVGLAIS